LLDGIPINQGLAGQFDFAISTSASALALLESLGIPVRAHLPASSKFSPNGVTARRELR
jgi:hypothetical protein